MSVIRGFWPVTGHCPAIAQSIPPVSLSTRKSTYHSPTVMTRVSVVSKGSSGSHRRDKRVVR